MRKLITGIIALLFILFYCTSCSHGPAWHLDKRDYHERKAIEKGATVDQVRKTVYDTVTFYSFLDRQPSTRLVDPVSLNDLCLQFVNVELSKSGKSKIANEIAEAVCPEVAIDTTYRLPIDGQDGKKYFLPITVKINASGTGHFYSIDAGRLDIPIREEETHTKIRAGLTWWQAVVMAIFCLVLGYVTGRVYKWFNP